MYLFRYLFLCIFVFLSISNTAQSIRIKEGDSDTVDMTIPSHQFHQVGKPLILHAGMEGDNAVLGGLGSIVRDLRIQSQERDINAYTCILYY